MNILEITNSSERQVYKLAVQELSSAGLSVKPPQLSRVTKVIHIRIANELSKIEQVVRQIGADIHYGDVPNLSGKFTEFAITFPDGYNTEELAGKTIYALSNIKSDAKIAQKQLIPSKLGLANKTFNKKSLVQALRSNIPTAINDEVMQQFLLDLVEVAIGNKPAVDPEIMEQISADGRRITGIDFGEVLTPLMLADSSDEIVFPEGNAMLADVEVNGKPIAVKSATGSGTSFKAINKYMDQFQDAIEKREVVLSKDEEKIHKFFRVFVDTPGKNVDKIIAASVQANTAEHQSLSKLIGKDDFSYSDLVEFSESFSSYENFLKKIYPVSTAGNYKIKDRQRPNGLPSDYRYYLGLTDKKPKEKQAGKPSWDANQGAAGANILTYILGTSFLADAKKLEKSETYDKMIKKILGNVEASLAKIEITGDGKISIKQTPFSEVDYQFQYHAPSHIPGNNLPGITLKVN